MRGAIKRGWTRGEVAKVLGISYNTLYYHLRNNITLEKKVSKGLEYFTVTDIMVIANFFGVPVPEEVKKCITK